MCCAAGGQESYTGVTSIQGRRYKRKMEMTVVIASGRGVINLGEAVAELIEGYGDQPTQIRWQLREGDEVLLPESDDSLSRKARRFMT